MYHPWLIQTGIRFHMLKSTEGQCPMVMVKNRYNMKLSNDPIDLWSANLFDRRSISLPFGFTLICACHITFSIEFFETLSRQLIYIGKHARISLLIILTIQDKSYPIWSCIFKFLFNRIGFPHPITHMMEIWVMPHLVPHQHPLMLSIMWLALNRVKYEEMSLEWIIHLKWFELSSCGSHDGMCYKDHV